MYKIRRKGNREYPTQVFWCSTRFCDGPILKPGQVEISQHYFLVVVFCVVHQVFQLNKMRGQNNVIISNTHKLKHPCSPACLTMKMTLL